MKTYWSAADGGLVLTPQNADDTAQLVAMFGTPTPTAGPRKLTTFSKVSDRAIYQHEDGVSVIVVPGPVDQYSDD